MPGWMSTQRPDPPYPWLLRRADQAAIAGLALMAIVALGLYWLAQGGWQGRLIEIDRELPRTLRFLVDVNRADWPELAQLPGIGESLAKRIVASRREVGPFREPDDLLRVRGIGPKTLDRVRPYLVPLVDSADIAER